MGKLVVEEVGIMKGKQSRQGASSVFGRAGERLAAVQLESQGYRILETNFRCRYGEIDLIVEDDSALVFVEVKLRRGTAFGLPEEAVDARKQRKLLQVAAYYIALHECAERSWRIDVIAIQLSSSGKLQEIRIYQHAITE
jgi:putative endonuclease